MSARIFVMGASPSGIDVLAKLVGKLPSDFPHPFLSRSRSPNIVRACSPVS